MLPISAFYMKRALKDGIAHECKECQERKKQARNEYLKKRGFPEELLPMEKTCRKCGQVLSQSMFRRNATIPDGLDSYCKRCRDAYYTEWVERPEVKEKKQAYRQTEEYKERRRIQARERYKDPRVKEQQRLYKLEYNKRDYVKARRNAYAREYSKRDYVKKKQAEYDARPDRKKKRMQTTKLWQQRQREKRRKEKAKQQAAKSSK
jgi:hypothetical protein